MKPRLHFFRLEDRTQPAVFTVNTGLDVVNPSDGVLSLREAIVACESTSEFDTIIFDSALDGQTLTLTAGRLDIATSVSIDGFNKIRLSGNNTSQIASTTGAANVVVFRNLTLMQGRAAGSGLSNTTGGAITNDGAWLTVEQSQVLDNSATSHGGAIANRSGTLIVRNSTLTGNRTDFNGGALMNGASMTVEGSTLRNNFASVNGGGIFNAGTFTLKSSTLDGNRSTFHGGGLHNNALAVGVIEGSTFTSNVSGPGGGGISNFGTLSIQTSSFSSNFTSGTGGALHTFTDATTTILNSVLNHNSAQFEGGGLANSGTTNLGNSTIFWNSAGNGGGLANNNGSLIARNITVVGNRANLVGQFPQEGGGIWNKNQPAALTTIHNSIIVGNLLGNGSTPNDLAGKAIESASSFNIVGDPGTAGGLMSGTNSNIVGTTLDAVFETGFLASNGGTTPTVALKVGGPAIDAGNNAQIPGNTSADQRGTGFARISNLRVDIGAFEYQSPTPVPIVPPTIRGVFALPPRSGNDDITIIDAQNAQRFVIPNPLRGFGGNVSVAVGDVNGDGTADLIVAAGAGGTPRVVISDGATGRTLADFFAFDAGFRGGVSIAVGDVTGDGKADIIAGAGAGGGPHVRMIDGATLAMFQEAFVFGINFSGGVNVAVGDVNGDGRKDVIAGAGAGGGPHVRAFDARSLQVYQDFFAFDFGFRGGVNLAADDVNQDGYLDIVAAAGPGGGPNIRVWRALDLRRENDFFTTPVESTQGVGIQINQVPRRFVGYPVILTWPQQANEGYFRGYDGRTGQFVYDVQAGVQ